MDKNITFTKVTEPVLPVRDPTSDIALLSRKGSAILKEVMEQKEKMAARKKFWELAGSQMGDILGVKKQVEDDDEERSVSTSGIKSSSQYKGIMDGMTDLKVFFTFSEKFEASSEFAKNKTLRQQREYLPIYQCREELLQVIRENSIVVIVRQRLVYFY